MLAFSNLITDNKNQGTCFLTTPCFCKLKYTTLITFPYTVKHKNKHNTQPSIAVYGPSEPGAGPKRQSRRGRAGAEPGVALPPGPSCSPRPPPARSAPGPPGAPSTEPHCSARLPGAPALPPRGGHALPGGSRGSAPQSTPPAALLTQPGLRHRRSRPRASGRHRRRLFCVAASTRERTEPFRAMPTDRGRGRKIKRRGAAGARPPPAAPLPLLRPR